MSKKALVVIDIQNDITKHYKDIIVTPTAYGQGLTFLMLTELMRQ